LALRLDRDRSLRLPSVLGTALPELSTTALRRFSLHAAFAAIVVAAAGLLAQAPAGLAAPNPGGQVAPGASSHPTTTAPPKPRRSSTPASHTTSRSGLTVSDARCLGPSGCTTNPRAVPTGGRLRLRGRGLKAGMIVVFPRHGAHAARSSTIGARLRNTHHGLVVTVPSTAISGRIKVVAPHGLRSNSFGPIRVFKPAPKQRPQTAIGASPTDTAFDGLGMWIWYVSKSNGGDLASIASQAQQDGITTLFIKSSDGSSNYWSQFSAQAIATLKAQGLRVCAWQYVYGTNPTGEAQLGAQAVSAGADCLVIDAESEYEGRYGAAQKYITALRAAVGPSYPIGLASFPYVDYHPQLPYSVFLGPGGAQFNAPQMYWHEIGTTVANVYTHTYTYNRIYQRTIAPLGQTYGETPPSEIFSFRQYAQAYGAAGLSFWDWQETTSAGWQALAQPLTPATGVSDAGAYPLLSLNSKGDPVLWMQEHLASAEPSTPTTGVFDSSTQTALTTFQTSRGLPASGQTDAATWQALLALAPVAVDWTGGGPSG
jgi:Putative peptidoglycan binding domain